MKYREQIINGNVLLLLGSLASSGRGAWRFGTLEEGPCAAWRKLYIQCASWCDGDLFCAGAGGVFWVVCKVFGRALGEMLHNERLALWWQ